MVGNSSGNFALVVVVGPDFGSTTTTNPNRAIFMRTQSRVLPRDFAITVTDLSSQRARSAIAHSVEEAQKLIETGFEYVCNHENVLLFRKRK